MNDYFEFASSIAREQARAISMKGLVRSAYEHALRAQRDWQNLPVARSLLDSVVEKLDAAMDMMHPVEESEVMP
jgi:tRNA threonylcarbamoyladenosine modification (KEOPS) complex Cgi121 subunit